MGGRWNRPGSAVVHVSATTSLALVEYLTHIDFQNAPSDMVTVGVEFEDDLIERTPVPTGWDETGSEVAKSHGDLWISQARSVVLAVPSVVIADERNYLINPRHPDFHRLRIDELPKPFIIDPRLFTSRR